MTECVKLLTSPTLPPLYLKKGQDCVVEGTRGMSVQFYVLIEKNNIERKPDPLLSPPNMFFFVFSQDSVFALFYALSNN